MKSGNIYANMNKKELLPKLTHFTLSCNFYIIICIQTHYCGTNVLLLEMDEGTNAFMSPSPSAAVSASSSVTRTVQSSSCTRP